MLIVMAFLLGAAIGSFLNVVILRLPEEDASIVFPGSHCPRCKQHINWFDNIPIVSFIILRGKCRFCRAPISWQYPLIELAMASLSLGLYAKYSVSVSFFIYFPFLAALLAIIFIDLRHFIIPDSISLPGIAAGFLLSFVNPELAWKDSVLGIVLGGGILYCIAVIYAKLKKIEGMGGGDIKLLGMIGAFLGWQSLPFIIFASSFAGTVAGAIVWASAHLGRKETTTFGKTKIPFGPFLALASMGYLFFDNSILYFIAKLSSP